MATIQGIYVALFARPADPLGLEHFETVTQGGRDLTRIGDLTSTEEYVERFAGQSNEEIITSIYRSLFNREPDAAGLAFFLDLMESGAQSVNTITINIMQGAQGADIATLLAKIEAADKFTSRVDTPHGIEAYHYGFTFQGDYSVEVARDYLAGVTAATPASDADADAAVLRLFPQVEIELADSTPTTGQTTQVTFTFTEPVVGFELEDVTVTGGTLSNLQPVEGNANAYTATFVAGSATGAGSLSIAFNAYEDRDGINGWQGSVAFSVGSAGGGGGTTPPVAGGQVANSIDEANAQNFAPTLLRAAAVSDNHISAGTLDYELASGAENVVFSWLPAVETDLGADAKLTSGGVTIEWELFNDGTLLIGSVPGLNGARTIIEVSLDDLASQAYSVTLRGGIDHPGEDLSGAQDQIELTFGYVIESSEGTIDSTLSIAILDSAPSLRETTDIDISTVLGGRSALLAEPVADLDYDLFDGPGSIALAPIIDGVREITVTIREVDFTYNFVDGSFDDGSSEAGITWSFDAESTRLTVIYTDTMDEFVIDFDDNTYAYRAGAFGRDGEEIIDFTVTDGDGDWDRGRLEINLIGFQGNPA